MFVLNATVCRLCTLFSEILPSHATCSIIDGFQQLCNVKKHKTSNITTQYGALLTRNLNQVGEYPPTLANRPPTPGVLPKWVNQLFFVILWPVEVVSGKSLKLYPPCHILKLKCSIFNFGWVFAPNPMA